MSEGDIQNLREECQAIRRLLNPFRATEPDRKKYPFLRGGTSWSPPTKDQLEQLQETVAWHMNAIADGQEVRIGPFNVRHETRFRRSTEIEKQEGYYDYLIFTTEIIQPHGNPVEDELLIRMARLLEEFADKIRRCPHCHNVFLQFRRNARFCGRECHSVAGMQKLRAARLKEAVKHRQGRGKLRT